MHFWRESEVKGLVDDDDDDLSDLLS